MQCNEMLSVISQSVNIPRVVTSSVRMLSVIKLSVIMLRNAMLSVISHSVNIPFVIRSSVI